MTTPQRKTTKIQKPHPPASEIAQSTNWTKKSKKSDILASKCEVNSIYIFDETQWNIGNENCLAWYTAQIYDFCIWLDFLDTKDLKKDPPKKLEGQTQNPKLKTSKFYNFSADMNQMEWF